MNACYAGTMIIPPCLYVCDGTCVAQVLPMPCALTLLDGHVWLHLCDSGPVRLILMPYDPLRHLWMPCARGLLAPHVAPAVAGRGPVWLISMPWDSTIPQRMPCSPKMSTSTPSASSDVR